MHVVRMEFSSHLLQNRNTSLLLDLRTSIISFITGAFCTTDVPLTFVSFKIILLNYTGFVHFFVCKTQEFFHTIFFLFQTQNVTITHRERTVTATQCTPTITISRVRVKRLLKITF